MRAASAPGSFATSSRIPLNALASLRSASGVLMPARTMPERQARVVGHRFDHDLGPVGRESRARAQAVQVQRRTHDREPIDHRDGLVAEALPFLVAGDANAPVDAQLERLRIPDVGPGNFRELRIGHAPLRATRSWRHGARRRATRGRARIQSGGDLDDFRRRLVVASSLNQPRRNSEPQGIVGRILVDGQAQQLARALRLARSCGSRRRARIRRGASPARICAMRATRSARLGSSSSEDAVAPRDVGEGQHVLERPVDHRIGALQRIDAPRASRPLVSPVMPRPFS